MLKKKPLLLVEDDPVQQALIERMLSSMPYSLTVVATAQEALDAFQKVGHEVVLCDINLPGELSGVDVLRRLKETPHPPVVVMLTGDSAIGNVIETMRLGAYDYLLKPVQSQELDEVIGRAFSRSQSETMARIAERERAEYYEKRLASRQVADQLVRRQNDKFARALFGNMFTSFSQGRGVGSLTTLVSMLGGAQLTEDRQNYLVPKDILDLINDNQDAVNAMIEMFSELHLLVSQDLVLHDVSLGEFHKIVSDLIFELNPVIEIRRHVVVLSELPPRFSGEVLKMNWEFMRKALRELLINALKFSEDESTITVLIEYKFTRVLVTVLNEPLRADTHYVQGIPEEYRKLVFEPFFRISRVVREQYRTLEYGLGLTLVDKIVYMHHGKIRCTTLQNFLAGEGNATDLVAFEIELPI
ncbi:MAG: response regulator [Spirochaetota bacterium]